MASGQLTVYGAQQLLGMTFGNVPASPPANFYLALTTALLQPNASGADVAGVEPPATSNYGRLVIPNTSTYWSSVAANQPYVANTQNHYWPTGATVGATADWPTCLGWALCDDPLSGHAWAVGTLASPASVPNGYCAYLGAGTLWVELSPFFQVTTGG